MSDVQIKLKEGASLNVEDVAKIACALKSLAVYTAMVCDEEENPAELKKIVEDGIDAMHRLFE